jgi:hypothetical protein
MELQKKIADAKSMDYDAAEAIKELLEQGPREAKKDLMDWEVEEFEEENILFYKEKNYVPIDAGLQREIVQRYHNHLTAGHPWIIFTNILAYPMKCRLIEDHNFLRRPFVNC